MKKYRVLYLFDDKVVEGMVYRVSCLTVRFNVGILLASYHRCRFIFNENTKVLPYDNPFIPMYGFSLVDAESVMKQKESFLYLVDVIGVVTKVIHDKKIYPDGRVTRSVTFKLNDQRRSFWCELSGDLVDEFRSGVKGSANGFPVVVLQFAHINIVQGSPMVQGVEGVTRLFVDPHVAEVINFRNGLVDYLETSPNYGGLIRKNTLIPMSHAMDFVKGYNVKTVAELKNDPEIGTFIVNARMLDIVQLSPWWFPVCNCREVFENYIGTFHCTKCKVKEMVIAPKVKVTFEVEDDTEYTLFRGFDHVLVDVSVVSSELKSVNSNEFYEAFRPVMGKSMMFIVKKSSHEPDFSQPPFELVRVSNHPTVIKFFAEKGLYKTASKVVRKRLWSSGKKKVNSNPTTVIQKTIDLISEYIQGAYGKHGGNEVGSSSGVKRAKV